MQAQSAQSVQILPSLNTCALCSAWYLCSYSKAVQQASSFCLALPSEVCQLVAYSHMPLQEILTFCVALQANYQLVLPNIRDYLSDIGAAVTMAGVVIGCCDIASIPGTIGTIHTHSFSSFQSLHCRIRFLRFLEHTTYWHLSQHEKRV